MNASSPKICRLASATGLAAVVAALAIPIAIAGGPSTGIVQGRSHDTSDPTVQDGGLDPAIKTAMAARRNSLTSVDPRSPDTGTLDPAIATAMAAHQRLQTPSDLRSPDTLDAAIVARQGSYTRSPDTLDAAARVRAPFATLATSPVPSDGFDWGNFGIAVAAVGAMFVLVGLGARAVTRQSRDKRPGSITAA